jgi:hypothetical protein
MTKRKYSKGARIWSMMSLASTMERGEYIYWRHKILHVGWWGSMPMRVLYGAVRAGIIYRAIPTDPKIEMYRGNQ